MTETIIRPRPQSVFGAHELPEAEVPNLDGLRVRIFADGADQAGILEMSAKPYIAGFTTNPTLMRKAGVANYRAFALDLLQSIRDRPISFEVFSDDFVEMERQAHEIASWGENVYVKIPITNTQRESAQASIRRLSAARVKLNITALMTAAQVQDTVESVAGGALCFISVFAGRIADTGRDPLPIMSTALEVMRQAPNAQLIWASSREVLNIFQADLIGCHVITVTNDLLKKLALIGKELDELSLETVRMFYNDARQAGYSLRR